MGYLDLKVFFLRLHCMQVTDDLVMDVKQAKTAAKSINELSKVTVDAAANLKETTRNAAAVKKLTREGNKSRLIQLGVTVFLIPEPTPICDIVGAGLIAAGAVQQAIKNQALYIDDIPRELQRTLRVLREAKTFTF